MFSNLPLDFFNIYLQHSKSEALHCRAAKGSEDSICSHLGQKYFSSWASSGDCLGCCHTGGVMVEKSRDMNSNCVTLGRSLHLSGPYFFSHLKYEEPKLKIPQLW